MREEPYWPMVFVARCENGWVVRQAFASPKAPLSAVQSGTIACDTPETAQYVFNAWVECAEFLEACTKPDESVFVIPILNEAVPGIPGVGPP